MRLFWGMIDVPSPIRHEHAFDAQKWRCVAEFTAQSKKNLDISAGEIAYHQNTCIVCGDLVERVFYRGTKDKNLK